ncbi:MAG: hypothetical protein JO261_12905 [Alphaproteobacteria bacterium]|nr:hypothetical protein [Alphaproteobacteria bacterium]MBV9694591.1 hypothetical protein [Alphaproteobacteria bacterium]
MRGWRFLLLGFAGLIVAACLPVTTDHPIGSTVGFRPDPRLIGLWKGHGEGKDDGDGYFAFLRNADGGMTAMLLTFENDADQWDVYDAQIATLGANHIMNVRARSKNGERANEEDAKQIIPIRYDIGRNGKLTLSLLDDKKTAAAIRAHKIKGESKADDDARLTAEPKELDAFFATKEGAALFSAKFVVLTKMK